MYFPSQDLSLQNVSESYQNLLQKYTDSGILYIVDGLGNEVFTIDPSGSVSPISASYALTASYSMNGGGGSSLETGSLYPITASWAESYNEIDPVFSAWLNTPPSLSAFVNDSGYLNSVGGNSNDILFNYSGTIGANDYFQYDQNTNTQTFGAYSTIQGNDSIDIKVNLVTAGITNNRIIRGYVDSNNPTIDIGDINTINTNLYGTTNISGNLIVSESISANIVQGNSANFTNISSSGPVIINGSNSYLQLLSTDNISLPISQSANYIYTSGSTNDLYFTQFTGTDTNTIRLKWLEHNLYTGLLHGGVLSAISTTEYQISSGSGIIVNLNASLTEDLSPKVQYLSWGNLSANIAPLSASYDQSFVGINNTGNIYAQGTPLMDGQIDTIIQIGVVLHPTRNSIRAVATAPQVGYGWKQRSSTFISAFGPLKLSGYNLYTSGSRGLLVGDGTAYLEGGNYLTDPNNPSYIIGTGTTTSSIVRYHQTGSEWVYDTNFGLGYQDIDPTQYSNNGTLSSVGAGEWSIQRAYLFPSGQVTTKQVVVYYCNVSYATKD